MHWFALLALPLILVSSASADEKDDLVAKQKMKALEHLKKADVPKPVIVETENLLVVGNLPAERLKSMGDIVQKHFTAAFKALKFEMSDNPPKGKLAIYLFPERKHYVLFIGEIQNERVEKDERSHADARSNEPYVAVTVLPGMRPTDLDVEASSQAAAALLQSKAGAAVLPVWMREGFAKAILMRSDPRAAGERARVKTLLQGKPGKYKVTDIWAAGNDPNKPLLGASLMEYFVFGPGSATLTKILSNLRPSDEAPMPTIDAALKSAEISEDVLDKAWKKWVTTGK